MTDIIIGTAFVGFSLMIRNPTIALVWAISGGYLIGSGIYYLRQGKK